MKKILTVFIALTLLLCPLTGEAAGNDDYADYVNPLGVMPIVNERIKLSVLVGDTYNVQLENNVMVNYLEDLTNIELDWTVDTSGEMKTLMLASGDYPDVFFLWMKRDDMINYGVNEQIFIPADDLIDKYSVNLKDRLDSDLRFRLSSTMSDDQIYGCPSFPVEKYSHPTIPAKFWINTEWLQNVGREMPTTIDELYDTLMDFKTKDPNKNGVEDEVPMSGAIKTAAGEPEFFLMSSFIYTDPNHFLQVVDGEVSFVANTPEYKEGLEYIKKFYDAGLIDPAAFTQDLTQLMQLGNNTDIELLGSFSATHPAMAVDISNIERSSKYNPVPSLAGPSGYRSARINDNGGYMEYINWAITDKCQYPEAAMRLIDHFYDLEFCMMAGGREGIEWDWVDDPTILDAYGEPALYVSHTYYSEGDGSVNSYAFPITLNGSTWGKEQLMSDDQYDPNNYGYRLILATNVYKPYTPEEWILPYQFSAQDSDDLLTIMVPLVEYVKQCTTRFITGDMNLDSEWDSYINALENLKVDDFVAIYQRGHDSLVEREASMQ